MDPLSAIGAAASIVQLVQLGAQVSVKFYTVSKQIKNAPRIFEDISNEINATSTILQLLTAELEDQKKLDLHKPSAIQKVNELVADCHVIFKTLFDKISPKHEDNATDAAKTRAKWKKRLKLPWMADELAIERDKLANAKTWLNFMLGTLQLGVQAKGFAGSQEMRELLVEQKQMLEILMRETKSLRERTENKDHKDSSSALWKQPTTEASSDTSLNLATVSKDHQGDLSFHGVARLPRSHTVASTSSTLVDPMRPSSASRHNSISLHSSDRELPSAGESGTNILGPTVNTLFLAKTPSQINAIRTNDSQQLPAELSYFSAEIREQARLITELLNTIDEPSYALSRKVRNAMHEYTLNAHTKQWLKLAQKHGFEYLVNLVEKYDELADTWRAHMFEASDIDIPSHNNVQTSKVIKESLNFMPPPPPPPPYRPLRPSNLPPPPPRPPISDALQLSATFIPSGDSFGPNVGIPPLPEQAFEEIHRKNAIDSAHTRRPAQAKSPSSLPLFSQVDEEVSSSDDEGLFAIPVSKPSAKVPSASRPTLSLHSEVTFQAEEENSLSEDEGLGTRLTEEPALASLSADQIQEFTEVFGLFDDDNIGRLSSTMFSVVLKSLGYNVSEYDERQLLASAGLGKDDSMSVNDFLNVMAKLIRDDDLAPEGLRHTFDTFDKETTNEMTEADMRTMLSSLDESQDARQVDDMIIEFSNTYKTRDQNDFIEFIKSKEKRSEYADQTVQSRYSVGDVAVQHASGSDAMTGAATAALHIEGPPPVSHRRRNTPPNLKDACITCRKRKVECDKGMPSCRTCQMNGNECGGYNSPERLPPAIFSDSHAGFGQEISYVPEDSSFNLDFSTLDNAEALPNFDFDHFLQPSSDDQFDFGTGVAEQSIQSGTAGERRSPMFTSVGASVSFRRDTGQSSRNIPQDGHAVRLTAGKETKRPSSGSDPSRGLPHSTPPTFKTSRPKSSTQAPFYDSVSGTTVAHGMFPENTPEQQLQPGQEGRMPATKQAEEQAKREYQEKLRTLYSRSSQAPIAKRSSVTTETASFSRFRQQQSSNPSFPEDLVKQDPIEDVLGSRRPQVRGTETIGGFLVDSPAYHHDNEGDERSPIALDEGYGGASDTETVMPESEEVKDLLREFTMLSEDDLAMLDRLHLGLEDDDEESSDED